MAVRASIEELITRVRDLIQDPATTAAPQFSDQQIQNALDLRRTEVRYAPLRGMPTFQPGNTIVYLDYYSDTRNWESDVVLTDLSYNVLTPQTSEPIVGHWTFAVQPNGIAVRATGKTHDLYGGAADLCEAWAAALKLNFDFNSDVQGFKMSQRFDMCLVLAARYRRQADIQVAHIVQADAMPDHDSAGIVYPAPDPGYW